MPVSQSSNIETILAEYDAIGRQDWDDLFRDAQPDFEFQPPDRGLGAGVSRGRDRARDDIKTFFEPFEEIVIEAQEFHERGDRIAVYFVMRTRPVGSSAMVEIRAGHLWVMREGRPARLEIHPEREKALEAAEVSEPDRSAS